jgi:hypothetical protein
LQNRRQHKTKKDSTDTNPTQITRALLPMVDRGILDMRRDLAFVDPRVRSQAQMGPKQFLPEQFRPGNWDIICHGGRENHQHGKWDFGSSYGNHSDVLVSTYGYSTMLVADLLS